MVWRGVDGKTHTVWRPWRPTPSRLAHPILPANVESEVLLALACVCIAAHHDAAASCGEAVGGRTRQFGRAGLHQKQERLTDVLARKSVTQDEASTQAEQFRGRSLIVGIERRREHAQKHMEHIMFRDLHAAGRSLLKE